MLDGLDGQVAIITGAAGALGSAAALAFLAAGAEVTAADRESAALETLAARVPADLRGGLTTPVVDVLSEASVRELVADVTRRARRLDVLVNVVGGFAPGDLLDTDEAAWDHMMALNLKSAYLCCRAALPPMIAARRGRIINTASRAVVPPMGGFIAYTVSKAGVITLTQALALEVRPHRITVNAVLPSTMDTDTNRRAMPDADRSGWVAPEAVARAMVFLASAAAADVTGTLLRV